MSTVTEAATTQEFSKEQDRVVGGLGKWMKVGSMLLLLTALLLAGLGVLELIHAIIGTGALYLVEAGLTFLLGVILMNVADSVSFIVVTEGRDKTHLMNAIGDLSIYLGVVIGLGSLLVIVLTSVWIFG